MAPNKEKKLPASARALLTEPIHVAVSGAINLAGPHTVPVSLQSWQHYASSLDDLLKQLQVRANEPPEDLNSFVSVRVWIQEVLNLRGNVFSLTLALRPFEYFLASEAEQMIAAVNRLSLGVAETVESGERLNTVDSDKLTVANWSAVESPHKEDPLSRAFGLSPEDIYDENGEFLGSRVFAAPDYYLQNTKLMRKVLPHLQSLGLPPVTDPLVAVNIVGSIESASDEVGAFCAMDSLFKMLLSRSNQDVVKAALRHIEEIELGLRQSRFKANRSFVASSRATEMEFEAMHLAEGYKRLLEGPVRQYGWLHHCMRTGDWASPPMLTSLKELLIKDGGWLKKAAESMILTEIRNGEAHENLLWDGINEVFITESGHFNPSLVHIAAVQADAFTRGSEAAVACYRALSIKPRRGGPVANDPGRSAAWLRAEANFGTNGLQLKRSNFNSKTAKITLARLEAHHINPCFQALLCCHALNPKVQRFEVYADGRDDVIMSVSAEALERTYPIWERAISVFSAMPLSTFLPINLDARSKSESPDDAVLSVAWIALDDLLDAVDSGPTELDADALRLLVERVSLVANTTGECLTAVPPNQTGSLRSVNSLAEVLLKELELIEPPIQLVILDELPAVIAARYAWETWGPVPRLPGVAASPQRMPRDDHAPGLRLDGDSDDLFWQTI